VPKSNSTVSLADLSLLEIVVIEGEVTREVLVRVCKAKGEAPNEGEEKKGDEDKGSLVGPRFCCWIFSWLRGGETLSSYSSGLYPSRRPNKDAPEGLLKSASALIVDCCVVLESESGRLSSFVLMCLVVNLMSLAFRASILLRLVLRAVVIGVERAGIGERSAID